MSRPEAIQYRVEPARPRGASAETPSRAPWLTLRGRLVLLVLATSLPLIAFGLLATFLNYRTQRDSVGQYVLQIARSLAQAVDADHRTRISALQALAMTRSLASDDLEAFRSTAERFIAVQPPGSTIGLADAGGQLLLAVGDVSPKTPLPRRHNMTVLQTVFRTAQPVVSDLFSNAMTGRATYTVDVPVIRDGRVIYDLGLDPTPKSLGDLLAGQRLDDGWIVSILDRNGISVARRPDNAEFFGRHASPSLLPSLLRESEGILEATSLEGVPVLTAFSRAKGSEWSVAIGVPRTQLSAPLWRLLAILLAVGAGLLLVSLLLARTIAGRITGPIASLAKLAVATRADDPTVTARPTGLREIDDVGRVLATAAEARRRMTEDLERKVDERTKEVTDANGRLVAEMARREQTEDQLRQLQKMEAVGQLTGGIAHDFNNMLAVIIGSLTLMRRRMARGEINVDRYLDAALDGAARATTLTQRLLAFSRQQPLAPVAVDANRFVAGMSELLRRTLGEEIRLETVLAGGLWPTHADPSQLENALLNLAVNGRDAMREGGRLTIETANTHLDEGYTAHHLGVPAGQYVQIAVTDTGSGMSPEIAAKAFDPFFTTKPVGRGTGLGLSQVYGFVRQSGGHIKIYSEIGQGTTVKIYLPRFVGQVDPKQIGSPIAADRDALLGDVSETVLVVEDEERVRHFTIEAIRELGYTVIHADNAVDALRQLDTRPDVSLLFTDIVMPDVNGRKLADEAQRRRPDLKVLFTTGYTRNAVVHNGVLDRDVSLITKPFTLEELARKIRDVLGARPR